MRRLFGGKKVEAPSPACQTIDVFAIRRQVKALKAETEALKQSIRNDLAVGGDDVLEDELEELMNEEEEINAALGESFHALGTLDLQHLEDPDFVIEILEAEVNLGSEIDLEEELEELEKEIAAGARSNRQRDHNNSLSPDKKTKKRIKMKKKTSTKVKDNAALTSSSKKERSAKSSKCSTHIDGKTKKGSTKRGDKKKRSANTKPSTKRTSETHR